MENKLSKMLDTMLSVIHHGIANFTSADEKDVILELVESYIHQLDPMLRAVERGKRKLALAINEKCNELRDARANIEYIRRENENTALENVRLMREVERVTRLNHDDTDNEDVAVNAPIGQRQESRQLCPSCGRMTFIKILSREMGIEHRLCLACSAQYDVEVSRKAYIAIEDTLF